MSNLAFADFPNEKVELIKKTVAKDCTNDELELFLYTCHRTGLDPLARQIYAVKRSGKMTIQTGIDGYRLIADRTGKLAGISDYAFDSEEAKTPAKATVTVRKVVGDGIIAEFTATARWGEYNAGGPMWAKMPYLMLGKCAEALALRKAFPADLSGVYTAEEMSQADSGQEAAITAEIERQKAAYTPAGTLLPPELDWSYARQTGVLICRPLSVVTRKRKTGTGEYLTLKLNNSIDGIDVATCFHSHPKEALLGSVGKICKFLVTMSKDGKFINIDEVLEIDGQKLEPEPSDQSHEARARLIASTLDFTEEDLRELHGRWCHGSWQETVTKLEEEKERRAAEGVEVAF